MRLFIKEFIERLPKPLSPFWLKIQRFGLGLVSLGLIMEMLEDYSQYSDTVILVGSVISFLSQLTIKVKPEDKA